LPLSEQGFQELAELQQVMQATETDVCKYFQGPVIISIASTLMSYKVGRWASKTEIKNSKEETNSCISLKIGAIKER
jgi:hypothetical protein